MSRHVTLLGGSPQFTLEYQLQQCQAALAETIGLAQKAGEEGEGELTPELRVLFIAISVLLVLFAGLMAGLTLGLLSLDKVDLEVIKRSGTPKEVWLVERVEPVVARPHFLLATLLLCNSMAMEALPIVLDRLLNPAAAILISVSVILVFGEIMPQALCKRYGLQVGANMAWFVRFLMLLTAAVTWPIGKLLDWVLGEESALFKRRELKALVSMHAEPAEDGEASTLTLDEVQVIQGALDMASKTAEAAMTPIEKVFLLSSEAEINDSLLEKILQRGHSRLPVYEGENKQNIVGLVLVKELLLVDEDAGVRVRDLRLRELPFMSADTPLYDVLKVFRFGRSHMSCLTRPDPVTGRLEVIGIITIEDVLEELLQVEIVDETDQYVDNLQSVRTSTLPSLHQLPPHLRRLLTRSIIVSAPAPRHSAAATAAVAAVAAARSLHGGGGGGRSMPGGGPAAASMGAAAAAGTVAGALLGGSPRDAVAASRRQGSSTPTKGPQLLTLSLGHSESGLLAQDKPPVPRRTSSSRRLTTKRTSSEGLHKPLLESELEGELEGQQAQQEQQERQAQQALAEQRLSEWEVRRAEEQRRMLEQSSPFHELAQQAEHAQHAEQRQQLLGGQNSSGLDIV